MKIKPAINRRKRQRGSSLVEGALAFMAFSFLTMGAMEMCMAVYAYNFVNYASTEGARYASMRGADYTTPATQDSIKNYVRGLAAGLTRSRVQVYTTWAPNNQHGSNVEVRVTYDIIPLVNLALRENLTVANTARAVISH